jgi:hypothetical protein
MPSSSSLIGADAVYRLDRRFFAIGIGRQPTVGLAALVKIES